MASDWNRLTRKVGQAPGFVWGLFTSTPPKFIIDQFIVDLITNLARNLLTVEKQGRLSAGGIRKAAIAGNSQFSLCALSWDKELPVSWRCGVKCWLGQGTHF